MNKVEASGRTTQEALRAAAQQIGVSVDELEYEVIEEGAKGFLGLGQTPTIIRAWKRQPSKPTSESESEGCTTVTPEPESQPQVSPETEPLTEPATETSVESEFELAAEGEPEPEQTAGYDAEAARAAEGVAEFLHRVLRAMGAEAAVHVRSASKEELVIDIAGKDVALLIGRHGQTLDALQYLCGIYASREFHSKRRIILDAEGYRERHKEMLERKALDYARAAVEAGKEAVLEPQPARDRRIIHLALANHPEVYTYSEGEGEARHVVISPKK